jgi:beta-glucanase (GH16 family)
MKIAMVLLLAALAFPASGSEPPRTAPTNWRQTFNEEFEHLDLSRWTTHYPWGGHFVPGSKEEEYYIDPVPGSTPFSIENGILTITADHASSIQIAQHRGRRYTSGALTSYPSFAQLYGYFEMQAQLPPGRGVWPAFWLLPTDLTWPPEIDVVETIGDPRKLYATVHYGRTDHHKSFAVEVPDDMTAGFHSYGVLWAPDYIAWYFDDRRIASIPTPSGMHKRMYLLVNLAVGGKWAGAPTPQTPFPARLQIEYIRAYALPDGEGRK